MGPLAITDSSLATASRTSSNAMGRQARRDAADAAPLHLLRSEGEEQPVLEGMRRVPSRVPDEDARALHQERRRDLVADRSPDDAIAVELVHPSRRGVVGVDRAPHASIAQRRQRTVARRKELPRRALVWILGADE